MPIGAFPIGALPIGATPPLNFVSGGPSFALAAHASISEIDLITANLSFSLLVASTIYESQQMSAVLAFPALRLASTLVQTDVATGSLAFPPLSAYGVIIAGDTAIANARFALRAAASIAQINDATAGVSFNLQAAANLQSVLSAVASLVFAQPNFSAYVTNNGTIYGRLKFPRLQASGQVLYGNFFAPPRNPQYPLDIDNNVRALSPQFGAGDPQFFPDGINVILKSGTLKFAVLSQADFLTIDTFITASMNTPIYYQLPDETFPRLWKIVSRTRRMKATVYEYEVMMREMPAINLN